MPSARALLLNLAVFVLFGCAYGYLVRTTPTELRAEQAALHATGAYSLPPSKLKQATALGRIRRTIAVANALLLPAALLLIVASAAAARMEAVACRAPGGRWAQGAAFTFLLLISIELLRLPVAVWGHRVSLAYGLSVQGWGGWLGDRAKSLVLIWALGVPMTMLLFWMMRRWGGRWWLGFWAAAGAVSIAGVFVSPYVIDPLFNRFTPLAQSNPALVAQLERVVSRGGLDVPPDRMFLMQASAKSTELNAYVTGFGASKRVVVWDTTVTGSSPDEIAFIFAHEMGHYALGHVALGTALSCLGMLPLFWAANALQRLLLRKYGATWGIRSETDWAALPVLLLVLTSLSAVTEPMANGVSRGMEHQADVYGHEAVHGIVSDPRAVGQHSFQVLGEQSLDDPTPHPAFERWFGSHPALWFRAGFAAAYDPWRPGEQPKYFAR